ncbi:MAG: aconitase family protein, partial [Planctomycetaceae bacterium]
ATMGFFPVDAETLRFLERTGRPADQIELVERYYKEQGLFRTSSSPEPRFTSRLELDLSAVVPSLAGPKRPQDRVALTGMKALWRKSLAETFDKPQSGPPVAVPGLSRPAAINDGAVVIAAITSCTN